MALKNTSTTARQASSPAQSGTLSSLEVARVAYSAGFRGNALTTAVAVAMAESGGNPKNVSPTDDHGLWQINRHYHPDYFKNAGQIYDPGYNAAAAFAISNHGTNWLPWSTFKSGAYKSFLGKGYPTGAGADAIIGSGTKTTSGGGWVPGLPDPGDLNPIKWVDEAAKNVVAFLKIMVDPVKLGEHVANAGLWMLKQLGKGIYKVFIQPPWEWTQRAVLYYWQTNIQADAVVGGQRYAISVKAIVTMSFWAVGYAILWGRFDPPEVRGVAPEDSALAQTVEAGRNMYVARHITKPKDVEKATAKKPEPKTSTIPLEVTRVVGANRRRTVKVTDKSGNITDEDVKEYEQQRDRDRDTTQAPENAVNE